jgi:hypothetical protein
MPLCPVDTVAAAGRPGGNRKNQPRETEMPQLTRKFVFGLAGLAAFAFAATAHAEDFTAKLDGASEVPPTTSTGTGTATVMLDKATKTLSWTVTYSGLTGDAGAGHFHGPAAAGANAGVVVPLTIGPSPIKGSAVLTDAQIADLEAGKWYVNIHTAANKGGEIRGQVVLKK